MFDSFMIYLAWFVVIALFTLPQLWFISFSLTLKSMLWRIITKKKDASLPYND